MVVGAHAFKAMKGFVVFVDLIYRNAQVSLNVLIFVSDQTQRIGLQELMLDISNLQQGGLLLLHEIKY